MFIALESEAFKATPEISDGGCSLSGVFQRPRGEFPVPGPIEIPCLRGETQQKRFRSCVLEIVKFGQFIPLPPSPSPFYTIVKGYASEFDEIAIVCVPTKGCLTK